jgi:hypothetical protein
MIEIIVNFKTENNTIGHLEYNLHTNNEQSSQNVLNIIMPYVLARLGGIAEQWNITNIGNLYTFEWNNINNKISSCPLYRTKTFRPIRDITNIIVS